MNFVCECLSRLASYPLLFYPCIPLEFIVILYKCILRKIKCLDRPRDEKRVSLFFLLCLSSTFFRLLYHDRLAGLNDFVSVVGCMANGQMPQKKKLLAQVQCALTEPFNANTLFST